MIYGTSLNICSEICQRCNKIALLRSGARSVSGRYPLRMSQPHTGFLISRQKIHFSKLLSSWTCVTLVFPIHADMVPHELWIEFMKCWQLICALHSWTSIKTSLDFMQHVSNSKGYANGLGNHCTSQSFYNYHPLLPLAQINRRPNVDIYSSMQNWSAAGAFTQYNCSILQHCWSNNKYTKIQKSANRK